MDNEEFIIEMFQEGMLCDCGTDPIWDRLTDENNRFMRYELAHKSNCIGRLKAAEVLKELEDGEV